MHHVVLILFSALLIATGLALGVREIRNPIRLQGVQRRMKRRLFGATLLCVLGGMIGNGPLPQGPVPREILMQSATYWAGVLALTFGLVALAIWDTVDGVRALGNHLETVEGEQLDLLQQRVAQARAASTN